MILSNTVTVDVIFGGLPRHKCFQLLNALFLLPVGEVCVNVCVDVQDHLLIRVPHPPLCGLQVDPGLIEHGAIGMPIIVAADLQKKVTQHSR